MARIGLVMSLRNTRAAEPAAALLAAQVAASAAALAGADMASHPAVAPCRAGYAQFGASAVSNRWRRFRKAIPTIGLIPSRIGCQVCSLPPPQQAQICP